MELKPALETIVADIQGKDAGVSWVNHYVVNNFLTPLSYVDAARNYQQRDFPLASQLAENLFLNAFKSFSLVDKKHERLNFLMKSLSWYEHKRLSGDDFEQIYPYLSEGKKIIKKYDSLKSEAEKTLIEFYFADAIAEIREKSKPKKRAEKT